MAKRQHYGHELWNRMCAAVREPDDLPEYKCGIWTIQKLFFLCQYLAQVTHAMHSKSIFSALNYVDLFCGPGICTVVKDGGPQRYPGSALLAAGCRKPFTNILLVEKDLVLSEAVKARIAKINQTSNVQAWAGDANQEIHKVANAIPDGSLTVAFVDPFSLDIHFDTIRSLANGRRLDLLILFADSMDLVRNIETYYYPDKNGKLDLFLGKNLDWRVQWDALDNRDAGKICQLFAELYFQQLKTLGYRFAKRKTIKGENGPLYRLIYASKHELGLKFWDIAASEDLGGNRTLFD